MTEKRYCIQLSFHSYFSSCFRFCFVFFCPGLKYASRSSHFSVRPDAMNSLRIFRVTQASPSPVWPITPAMATCSTERTSSHEPLLVRYARVLRIGHDLRRRDYRVELAGGPDGGHRMRDGLKTHAFSRPERPSSRIREQQIHSKIRLNKNGPWVRYAIVDQNSTLLCTILQH